MNFNFWEAIMGFMGSSYDRWYKEPSFAPNKNHWQRRSRANKCHKWEHYPHKHIKRVMAKRSRQINRRRAA